MQTLETIRELNRTLENEHVRAHRARGGKVVGYSCVFTPVEVLEAAGVMPYRIKAHGHPDTDLADARLSRFNCRFCRACLQLGLDGTYDFLDGLLESNGCDQLRGMFENWEYAASPGFFHYLKAPHLLDPDALDHFALEIRRMREAVEAHFDARITDDDLREAGARLRRVREKLTVLDDLRAAKEPALTGSEALQVVLAGAALPTAVFEELLDGVLAECRGRRIPVGRARLLIGGAATDEPALIAAIEELGGIAVADTLCYGARSYRPLLEQQSDADDPHRALAETYLRGSRCPRMYDEFDTRLAFVREAIHSASVEGVILLNNKFCDLHGFDNALLRLRLEEQGVPVLSLEKEYGSQADHGRVRTRVQAFLERIGGRQ